MSRGVLWDMDGVLVDSGPLHREAWGRLAAGEGRSFPAELFARVFGLRNDDILRQLFGPGLPAARREELAARKEELYRALARGRLVPAPGAAPLARALHEAGWRQAVASSGPRANVELMLAETGLGAWIGPGAAAEDVRAGKPDPQVFLAAAARLGLEPAACLVVEDAPAGVEAGLRAGMRVVAVAVSHPPDRLGAAHLVVPDLTVPEPAWFEALLAALRSG